MSPNDVAVLDPTPFAELTLTTCNPRYSATSRLVIVARWPGRPPLPANRGAGVDKPVGAATPPPESPAAVATTPSATATAAPGRRRSHRCVVVALWVAARILVNRTRPGCRWRLLSVGIAVCLVNRGSAFENTVRLLAAEHLDPAVGRSGEPTGDPSTLLENVGRPKALPSETSDRRHVPPSTRAPAGLHDFLAGNGPS